MSRSAPNETAPHPCSRWYAWNGEKGNIRWYDKQNKTNVEVGLPFNFILLDQLAAIRGWSEKMGSGIYSNEVKDTRSEPLTVKYFKGGNIAGGLYAEIKDTIVAAGGYFVLNCYVAHGSTGGQDSGNGDMSLCSIQFKGAALGAWMEFEKKNRSDIWKDSGVIISGYKEGQKGKVKFRVPEFELREISREDNDAATVLDRSLQTYLRDYFNRGKIEPPVEALVQEPDGDSEIPF